MISKFKAEDGITYPVYDIEDYLVITKNGNEYLYVDNNKLNLLNPFINFPVIESPSIDKNNYWLVEKHFVLENENPYDYFIRLYNKKEEKLRDFSFRGCKKD